MQTTVVVGSLFGDEGKGLTVDYVCGQMLDKFQRPYDGYVVRFNGGCQAGHTVVTPDGKRFVFGHFGSGCFLDVPTFLSKFFIVNPIMFKKDHIGLLAHNLTPKITIDGRCFLTTPYDMILNQAKEIARGDNGRHGSVGMGVGETVERCVNSPYKLVYSDISCGDFMNKVLEIRDKYVLPKFYKLLEDCPELSNLKGPIESEGLLEAFFQDCQYILSIGTIADLNSISRAKFIVFEGAQGLALDEDYGFFPFVTRSRTGFRNALKVADEISASLDEVIYVTRAYTTRHGAGPLPFETTREDIAPNIIDATNIKNLYQGHLRFAPFNLDLFNKMIALDAPKYIPYSIMMTCIDQLGDSVPYISENKLYSETPKGFMDIMMEHGVDRISTGPTRDDVINISLIRAGYKKAEIM